MVLIWLDDIRRVPCCLEGVMSLAPLGAKLLLDRFIARFGVTERQSLLDGLDHAVWYEGVSLAGEPREEVWRCTLGVLRGLFRGDEGGRGVEAATSKDVGSRIVLCLVWFFVDPAAGKTSGSSSYSIEG